MKKPIALLMTILMIGLGIAAIVMGIHQLAEKDLYDSTVTATVSDIEEEWNQTGEDSTLETTVYIDYEIDGVTYTHVPAPEQKNNMQVGDKVDILYQSQNPEKISGQNITGTSVIFIALGAVVTLVGCITTLRTLFARR